MRNVTSAKGSGRNIIPQLLDGPISPPKQAFRTPRSVRSVSNHSEMSDDSMSIGTDPDEGVAMEVAPSQADALQNMKNMMAEENMNIEQQKTLDSLRSAIRTLSREQSQVQLERTVTILSLASQIARESVELGILPDGVFDGFAKMDSRSMSVLSDKIVEKGEAASRLDENMKVKSKSPDILQHDLKTDEVCGYCFKF